MPVSLPVVSDILTRVGQAIAVTLPEAVDGSSPTYALTGLPAGATFTAADREIGGATNAVGPHWLTYTVTSGTDTATRRFVLAVLPALPEWMGGQTPTPADLAQVNAYIAYNAGRSGNVYKPAPIVLPGSIPQSVLYVDNEGRVRDLGEGEAGQYVASGGPAAAPAWTDFDAGRRSEKLNWPTSGSRGFGITHTADHGLGTVPRVVGVGLEATNSRNGFQRGDILHFPMGWTEGMAYPLIVWATSTQVRIQMPSWTRTIDTFSPTGTAVFLNSFLNSPTMRAAVYVHG